MPKGPPEDDKFFSRRTGAACRAERRAARALLGQPGHAWRPRAADCGGASRQSRNGVYPLRYPMAMKGATIISITAASHGMSAGSTGAAGLPVSVWIPVISAGAAALIAAAAAIWSGTLQRKSGKEAAAAAGESAAAALASAEASRRSAAAAEDSVEVSRKTATDVGKRADAAALAERYQDAASQLGHDKAAVRLAGVYAIRDPAKSFIRSVAALASAAGRGRGGGWRRRC
jgi:hypothetical protein